MFLIFSVCPCLGKKWLFWFLERWLVLAKTKCAICGSAFYTDAQRFGALRSGGLAGQSPVNPRRTHTRGTKLRKPRYARLTPKPVLAAGIFHFIGVSAFELRIIIAYCTKSVVDSCSLNGVIT